MNGLLIIQTQKYPDTLAVYAIENEYATVVAKDDIGQTIPFVCYVFYFEESKIGFGSTDLDGVIKYEATTVDSICLTNWFGQQIGFAVQPGYSYVAELGSNPVIEKKTVIFKILELNDEILRLQFLDYDHYLPTYNPERLKKIVRRAKWQKTDIRYLEKRS